MQILKTAVVALILCGVGASPSWAVFAGDLGTIPVPGTAGFTRDTIQGNFDNDWLFTIEDPAPRGGSTVIEIELLPTFEIEGFTLSLHEVVPGSPPTAGTQLASTTAEPVLTGVHAAALSFPSLGAPASYILKVAGLATGTSGGRYSGTIALVPLPGAALLFVSALIGLGTVRWWRREAA